MPEILIRALDQGASLLKFGQSRAFMTLSVEHMKQLALQLGIPLPTPRPTTELAWCLLLLTRLEPTGDFEEFKHRYEKYRGHKVKASLWATVISQAEAECVDAILDKYDAKAIRATANEKAARAKATLVAAPKAKAGPKKLLRKPRLDDLLSEDGIAREDGATYLPKGVKGCCLAKDTTLHMRWKASYPNPKAPFSASCVWNASITERQAHCKVLRWAWACHKKVNPTAECPWDIEHSGVRVESA